jgi:23S rRNA (adenine2030-N6)-methyltransferase
MDSSEQALFHGRCFSDGNLLGGDWFLLRSLENRRKANDYTNEAHVCTNFSCKNSYYPITMFSYRHAFHAGNHADVLKHAMLVHVLHYLTQKDKALQVIDTHAGAGLYRLRSVEAKTSAESSTGIMRLLADPTAAKGSMGTLVSDYLKVLARFNQARNGSDPFAGAGMAEWRQYPGSPFLTETLLRDHDRLHVFEVHPTDQRLLRGLIGQRDSRHLIHLHVADGFAGVRPLLPPPSRRGLLICDPSYEIKSDYAKVVDMTVDALQRFATGCMFIWYPIVARPEAHDLPRKLKNAAIRAGKPWLYAALSVKSGQSNARGVAVGLSGSGVFVINPPFTLLPALKESLPHLVKLLAQDNHAGFELEHGNG